MIKIALLEDEEAQAQRMLRFLNKYQEENPALQYTVERFERGRTFLQNYKVDYDLLFLDIRLPDMLGIDVAHRVREIDPEVMIVFVTSLTQYAIEGYSVQAFDYMVKPIAYDSFSSKLTRMLRMLSYKVSNVQLIVKTKEASTRVNSDSILYVEVSNHDLLIHTDHGVLKQWGSLSKVEKALQGAQFAKCNSCYLVNLKYVAGIQGDQVKIGSELLTISKPRRKEFLQRIAQYEGGSY